MIYLLLALIFPATAKAELPPVGVSLGAYQYATDSVMNSRVSLNNRWVSGSGHQEVWLNSFFESGREGDHSFDVPVAVWRMPTSSVEDHGHLWIGRGFPFAETQATSAVGSSWVQNQSDALSPQLTGWLGAGWMGPVAHSGVSLSAAISPIFLPTFGPRLELSETDSAQGSRFARLPPAYLQTDLELIPLRYRVNIGELQSIIFQYQYFFSLSTSSPVGTFTAMHWSAPRPSPETNTSAAVLLNQDKSEVNVLAIARPYFPRESFVGVKWTDQLTTLSAERVVAEALYELNYKKWIFSLEVKPYRSISVGLLEQIEGQPVSAVASFSMPYAKDLVWTQWTGRYFKDRFLPHMRWEHHWTAEKQDDYLAPGAEYLVDEQLALFASASILTGEDGSYLGQWRSLDSMVTGLRFQW